MWPISPIRTSNREIRHFCTPSRRQILTNPPETNAKSQHLCAGRSMIAPTYSIGFYRKMSRPLRRGGMSRPPPVAGGGRRVSGSGRNFVSESRTENFGHRNRSSSSARAHECCSFASVRANSLNRTARAIHDRPYIIHRTPPPKSAKKNAPFGAIRNHVTLPGAANDVRIPYAEQRKRPVERRRAAICPMQSVTHRLRALPAAKKNAPFGTENVTLPSADQ